MPSGMPCHSCARSTALARRHWAALYLALLWLCVLCLYVPATAQDTFVECSACDGGACSQTVAMTGSAWTDAQAVGPSTACTTQGCVVSVVGWSKDGGCCVEPSEFRLAVVDEDNKNLALAGQSFTTLHDSGAGVKQTCYSGASDVTTTAEHGGGRDKLFVLFKAESFKGSDDSTCIVTYGATFSCTGLTILTHTGACFSNSDCRSGKCGSGNCCVAPGGTSTGCVECRADTGACSQCSTGYYLASGACQPTQAAGTACSNNVQCDSGKCGANFRCCGATPAGDAKCTDCADGTGACSACVADHHVGAGGACEHDVYTTGSCNDNAHCVSGKCRLGGCCTDPGGTSDGCTRCDTSSGDCLACQSGGGYALSGGACTCPSATAYVHPTAGDCRLKELDGDACTGDSACDSGACRDGVCCTSDATAGGGCDSCASGSGDCDACASTHTSSGTGCVAKAPDGDACGTGAECQRGSCKGGKCCDTSAAAATACTACGAGTGVCSACANANYVLAGDGTCACASDAYDVGGGVCQPKVGDGGACDSDSACTSGRCLGGRCCNTGGGDSFGCEACGVTPVAGDCTACASATHQLTTAGACAATVDGAVLSTRCATLMAACADGCAPGQHAVTNNCTGSGGSATIACQCGAASSQSLWCAARASSCAANCAAAATAGTAGGANPATNTCTGTYAADGGVVCACMPTTDPGEPRSDAAGALLPVLVAVAVLLACGAGLMSLWAWRSHKLCCASRGADNKVTPLHA